MVSNYRIRIASQFVLIARDTVILADNLIG
jgi:hypothetical protein